MCVLNDVYISGRPRPTAINTNGLMAECFFLFIYKIVLIFFVISSITLKLYIYMYLIFFCIIVSVFFLTDVYYVGVTCAFDT